MTNEREQVKRALWHLERERMPLRDPADEAVRRQRMAAAVNGRVRELEKKKRTDSRRRRLVALTAVAAAAAAVAVSWLRPFFRSAVDSSDPPVATLEMDGAASVVRGGHPLEARAPEPIRLAADDELRTAGDGHARAVLASGAVVNVESETALRFEGSRFDGEPTEELNLEKGSVLLKVPKLGPHRRLSVRTPEAIVTVRGTEFRVDVREREGHSMTGVKVLEGSVWVLCDGHAVTVEKGSEWSSDASEPRRGGATDSTPSIGTSPIPAPSVVASAQLGVGATGTVHDETRSTLGAENDQYQRAVAAARAGDDRKALSAFDRFLARFPASPLAQTADVERFRALKRLGRSDEAARRARQYLAAYPSGFARAEAQALSGQAVGPPNAP